ncbi:MAG TPA: DUF3891 family protein [Solirubrobacteraceae bacterium]|jgi:hypothetical protein
MLLRRDEQGMIAIGQASHAWISGQMARAWGNPEFGAVEPWEEVCLAAEQHDTGMAAWDLEPTLNPETGLPHSFIEMPLATHVELWTAGPRRLISQSRYAALLVSMHGARLYERRDLSRLSGADGQLVRDYLKDQRRLQEELRRQLGEDPKARPWTAPERVKRNSDLLWTWDLLSLALCLDWAPHTAKRVPTAGTGSATIELTAPAPATMALEPWPFAAEAVPVHCDGARLSGTYGSQSELQAALADAPRVTANFELRRA